MLDLHPLPASPVHLQCPENRFPMANAWRRDKSFKFLAPRSGLLVSLPFLALTLFFLSSRPFSPNPNPNPNPNPSFVVKPQLPQFHGIEPFDCFKCPQVHPVIASVVEGVKYPFLYALSDLGFLPDKPHKNIVRLLKNKPFRKPDISVTIQGVLERIKGDLGEKIADGLVIDVGANVGMATFAAAVMGFRVLAFEPIFENLQRICDGIYFNRVGELVTVFDAAASDRLGNITVHKLVGRLDNSAVSAAGAKLAFKSNKEVAIQIKSIPLDVVVPESERIFLIKIDVQGWEHHVLKGASKLLSRKPGEAPYLIYEEDEQLLQASNSTSKGIRSFLESVGYNHCERVGTDAHCTKKA